MNLTKNKGWLRNKLHTALLSNVNLNQIIKNKSTTNQRITNKNSFQRMIIKEYKKYKNMRKNKTNTTWPGVHRMHNET